MASYTTNLNLKKPAGSENVAIGDINNNMDTIDQAYGTLISKLSGKIGYVDTPITGSVATQGNGMYYLESDIPTLPTGAVYLFSLIKSALFMVTENISTGKLYIYTFEQKPTSTTYNVRTFYYIT